MATFFAILFLFGLIALFVGLTKPSIFNKVNPTNSRGKILLWGSVANTVLLALVGVFAPKVENANSVKNEEKPEAKVEQVISTKTNIESSPVIKEINLGMTPEEFRTKFNAQLKKIDIKSLRPLAEFNIENGSVRNTFQVSITDAVGMIGTVNKDGGLREINFIYGGGADTDVAEYIILTAAAANVLSPMDKTAPKKIVDMLKKSLEHMGTDKATQKSIIGDKEYTTIASKVTGAMVIISPKE